jgi:hypothetical protein
MAARRLKILLLSKMNKELWEPTDDVNEKKGKEKEERATAWLQH